MAPIQSNENYSAGGYAKKVFLVSCFTSWLCSKKKRCFVVQLGLYRTMSLYNTSCDWLSGWRGISGLIRRILERSDSCPQQSLFVTPSPLEQCTCSRVPSIYFTSMSACVFVVFLSFHLDESLCHNKLPKRV